MVMETIFLRVDGRRWMKIKVFYYTHICRDRYKIDNQNVKKATILREFIEYSIDKITEEQEANKQKTKKD